MSDRSASMMKKTLPTIDPAVTAGHVDNLAASVRLGDANAINDLLVVVDNSLQDDIRLPVARKLSLAAPQLTLEAVLDCITANCSVALLDVLLGLMSKADYRLTGDCSSHAYPSYMTPLMLAGMLNNHAHVRLLLSRGHTLQLPHRAVCKCDECAMQTEDGTLLARQRLHLFWAMGSRAYLWLATGDPIALAVQVSERIKASAQDEYDYQKEYASLLSSVTDFMTSVVHECRSTDEVLLMMRQKTDTSVTNHDHLPRVVLALDTHSTPLLVDKVVQLALYHEWNGGDRKWTVFDGIAHSVFYPFVCILFLLTGGTYPKSFAVPFARYLTYSSAYTLFLCVLLLVTQTYDETEETRRRGFTSNGIEYACNAYLWLYALGMFWWDVQGFMRDGFQQFFSVWWHLYDIVLGMCYCNALICMLRAEAWSEMDGNRESDRVHWPWFEPQLLYECAFSCAILLSICRVFFFMQVHKRIGPMLVSICGCITSTFHYLFMIAIMSWSFAIGLSFMYKHYSNRHVAVRNFDHATMWKFRHTSRLIIFMYWGLFGYFPPEHQVIAVGRAGPEYNKDPTWHVYTQVMGEFTLMIFSMVAILCLLKLMISMLVNVATQIQAVSDTEWRMTRCHIWREFSDEANILPPPFNILWMIVRAVRAIYRIWFNPEYEWSFPVGCSPIEPDSDTSAAEYAVLVGNLHERWHHTVTVRPKWSVNVTSEEFNTLSVHMPADHVDM